MNEKQCNDVYCRIKARKRMIDKGLSPKDAFLIAEEINDVLEGNEDG